MKNSESKMIDDHSKLRLYKHFSEAKVNVNDFYLIIQVAG